MMRLKLVGAQRSSFKGAPGTIVRGKTVDVDDNVGATLLERRYMDVAGNARPIWELVESTEGDSAAELDAEEEVEEEVEEEELDEEEEEEVPPTPPAPKKKVSPKRKAAPKKARTRKPPAA